MKTKLVFYVESCLKCFFYSDGMGWTDAHCNHEALKGKGNLMDNIINPSRVPDDCPARDK